MRPLRPLALLLAAGLLLAGCGLGPDPVVAGEDDVIDALLTLADGAEGRLTATLEYDEDEVRDALRGDAEARALLEEQLGTADTDALLADLRDARDRLADHALLLGTGSDGSGRVAAEYRGEVWLDLRVGGVLRAGEAADATRQVDLQARVDWTTVAELVEQPDLLGDLDDVATQVAPFLDALPDTDAVQRVLLGLLGGELVAISGPAGPQLLDGLGALLDLPTATASGLRGLDLDPRALLATALAVDGIRVDEGDTLVDVHLELRAAGALLLDRVAASADELGLSPDDVAAARGRVAELPERLEEVAVLRLGSDGAVTQVRVDVVDLALQLAPATGSEDPRLAVAERVAAELDATGLFAVLDVTAIGTTPTVLGDPAASATPEEVARALGGVLFGGLAAGFDADLQDLFATTDGS